MSSALKGTASRLTDQYLGSVRVCQCRWQQTNVSVSSRLEGALKGEGQAHLLLAKTTQVDLAAARRVVALRAADEAALTIPKSCLAVLALGASGVGADLRVDADRPVDRATDQSMSRYKLHVAS